jgi:5,10-methenyltetrahydrofolate synthetase
MANQKFNPTSQTPIAVAKQQWRVHLKNLRQHLPIFRQEEASVHACQKLSTISQHARFILSFASFGSEINLWPFNHKLCGEGRLVLPLVTAEKGLFLCLVTHFDQLEAHRWGMLEPKMTLCKQIDLSLIEIALIPGLGFDLNNNHR